jgi:hypothetical protein
MAFIINQFGTYNNYLQWAGGKWYDYIVTLNYEFQEVENYVLPLKNLPDGIKEIGKKQEVHSVYKGFLTALTLKLKFSLDPDCGGTELKAFHDVDFVRSDVGCSIYKWDPDTNDFDIWFSGKIDFSPESYSHDYDYNYIEANIIEGGSVAELLASDELEINIEDTTNIFGEAITDITLDEITIPPIDIYEQAKAEDVRMTRGTPIMSSGTYPVYPYSGDDILNSIGDDANLTPILSDYGIIYTNNNSTVVGIKLDLNVTFNITSNVSVGDLLDGHILISIVDSSDILVKNLYIKHITNIGEGVKNWIGTEVIAIDYENLNPDYKILYYSSFNVTVASILYFDLSFTADDITMTLKSDSPYASTKCLGYYLENAFKKITRKITRTADVSLQVPEAYYDFITSGKGIRQNPEMNALISFRKLFQMLDTYANVFMTYDSDTDTFLIKLDDLSWLNYLGGDLGEAKNLKMKASSSMLFNELKIGWPDTSNEEFKLAYDYIGTSIYSTTVPYKNSKSIISQYRADCVAIELTRRQQYSNTWNTEYRTDSNIFVIRCDSSGAPILANHQFVGGFIGVEQYYNLELSAWHCIVNHSSLIRACLYLSDDVLRFASAIKKNGLVYVVSMNLITEYADVDNERITIIKYLPVEVECEIMYYNITDPYRYYTIQDKNGVSYSIYIRSFETTDSNTGIKIKGYLKP